MPLTRVSVIGMSTDTNTPAASTAATVTVRLSCRHVIDIEPAEGQPTADNLMGQTVECGKCPAKKSGGAPTRRIKAVLTTADTGVADPDPEPVLVQTSTETEADRHAIPADPEAELIGDAERAAERGDATLRPSADRLVAEAKRGPRVVKASAEARALKAWTEGGEKGDRPATPNLEAIEAEKAAEAADKAAEVEGRKPGTAPIDPANPMGLGVAQGPVGMVDSSNMTADQPTPAKRTRKSRAPEGRVTDLNLSPVRRTVMLAALPEDATGSVKALRAAVAAEAKRVDVDADGVRALLTGLAPLCKDGDKAACKLNEWLMKFAEQVGWKAPA